LTRRSTIKKILLVEDEPHKKEELTTSIESFFKEEAEIDHVNSVHAAYWAVSDRRFDLIILDMALPTFTAEGNAAERGFDQAQGGVEVLRALKSRNSKSKIIIITQYPDITFGGKRLKLSEAPKILSQRYDQDVVGSVLYKYRSPSNHTKLIALLRKLT
jgi:CheY-like chemotaxis protein